MTQVPSSYTPGEIRALLAPLLDVSAEDLDAVYLIAVTNDHQLVVQSNIHIFPVRLQLLLHTIQYEVSAHTIPRPDDPLSGNEDEV